MSAIAGIVHLDGRPVARAALERMSSALEDLGRDKVVVAPSQCAGFVSRVSIFTAEDRLERQPVSLPDRSLLIVDGRIDNREELQSLLGLTSADLRLLSDSALIARAWARWQRACLERLVGHFALAHWAPSERQLTLARSAPIGKPLFVYRKGTDVFFASAPPGLFALPEIPRALDERTLGDLLLRTRQGDASLFADITQVRNSEWLCHGSEGTSRGRYWQLDPRRQLGFRREEEAWEALRPLFAQVVTSHLRSAHPVGVQMSGGLDSAAVAGQAAELLTGNARLRGYTRVPNAQALLKPDGLTYSDERPRVELIARRHSRLEPTFVPAGDEPVLDTLAAFFGKTYTAFAISPTYVTGYEPLYRRAAEDGIRVLLHGSLGNFSLSWDGLPRLRTLMLHGRWLTLARELFALRRFRRGNIRGPVRLELLQGLVPNALRWRYFSRRNDGATPWAHYSSIKADFAQETGATRRLREESNLKLYWAGLESWQRRAWAFESTVQEWFYSVPTRYGMDFRDPTADRRLVEFCLALPDELYFKDGIERRLIRLGMAHLIPEPLCLDPRWGRQDVDWVTRMQREAGAIESALATLEGDEQVCRYLDIGKMRALWQRHASIDWRRASTTETVMYKQALLGGIAVGQFVRWFEGRN